MKKLSQEEIAEMNNDINETLSREIVEVINRHNLENGAVLATLASVLGHCQFACVVEDEKFACEVLSDYLQFAHIFMHMSFEQNRNKGALQ